MDFKSRIKHRRLKRVLNFLVKIFYIRSLSLKKSQKIILFWIFFNFIALFLPWIDFLDSNLSYNAFAGLSWNIGILIFIILLFLLFNLFSINNKEKIQLHISIHFRDYPVTIIFASFIFLLSVLSINFINAMQFFSSTIIYGMGIVMSITSSIVIWVWWLFQRLEFHKYSKTSKFYEWEEYYDNSEKNISSKNKKNMKLPF